MLLVFVGFPFIVTLYRDSRMNSREIIDSLMQLNHWISSTHCVTSSCWDNILDATTVTGAQIIQYFLWTNRSSCQLAQDIGGRMLFKPSALDGQKSVCLDPKVVPQPGKCLVYSFGIDYEWSFDEQMELYGCEVFAFDPSMDMDSHDHSVGVHFYDWGLGHRNERGTGKKDGWNMRTLSSIYETLSSRHGPNRIIDYLKMDIEYDEWLVIPDIIQSGMLSRIRQFGAEFHVGYNRTIDDYKKLTKILRSLEKEGMVRFDSKYNPWLLVRNGNFTELKLWASTGYEIAWYNSKLQHNLQEVISPVSYPESLRFYNGFQDE